MDYGQNGIVSGDTFPAKLHKLLSHVEKTGLEHIVSWLPGSNKFRVHSKELFAEEIMPNFFSSSAYKTFQRNLNLWGFRTISKGVHKGECSHDQFVRGDIERCRRMVRVRIKSEGVPEDQDLAEEAAATVGSALVMGSGTQQQTSVAESIAPAGNFLGMIQPMQQIQHAHQTEGYTNSTVGNALNGSNRNDGSDYYTYLSNLAALMNNTSSAGINAMSALQNQLQPPVPAPVQVPLQVSLLQQLLLLQHRQTQAPPPPPPQPRPAVPLNQQLLALLAIQHAQGINGNGPGNRNLMSNEMNVNPSGLNLGSNFLSLSQPQQPDHAHTIAQLAVLPRMSSPTAESVSSPDGSRSDAGESSRGGQRNMDADQASQSTSLREAAVQRISRVIGCRARGMPMDHNMHTAYFEIPMDAEQGMELVCSFPACRNGGVKFLFCLYCNDAIARRSFRTSHTHEDRCRNIQSLEAESTSSSTTINDLKSAAEKRLKRSVDDAGLGALADAAVGSANNAIVATETPIPSTCPPSTRSTSPQPYRPVSREVALKAQWDQLLEERRKENSNNAVDVTSWLAKVMAVSNEFATLPISTEKSTS